MGNTVVIDLEMWKLVAGIGGVFIAWSFILVGVILWLNKQFENTRHTLRGSMDMRVSILSEERKESEKKINDRIGRLEDRVHNIELRNAGKNGAA